MKTVLVSKQGDSSAREIAVATLASGLIYVLAFWQALGDPLMVNDDTRQQIFWMRSFMNPGLFDGHWLVDYARAYTSWGVRGLYWLAGWIMDPMLFSKILPGLEFMGLVAAMYVCGRRLLDRRLAWILVLACWLSPVFMDRMSGGLARSFAYPLLVLFLAAWLEENGPLMAVALLLQALFIPYVCLLSAGAACSAFVLGRLYRPLSGVFFSRWWHWVVLAASAALVLGFSKEMELSGFGPFVDRADVIGRPVFAEGGRFPIYPIPSVWYELLVKPWKAVFSFRHLGVAGGLVLLTATLGGALTGLRRVEVRKLAPGLTPFLHLLLSSCVLYLAARILLFKLFVPARFFEFSLTLLLILALGVCLHGCCKVMSPDGMNRPLKFVLGLGVVLLSALFLHDVGICDYGQFEPARQHVASTDEDSLFAGHPYLMDNVLALGNRPVVASFELAHPWSKGLWARLEPDMEAMLEAYYAKDRQVVDEFVARYGVDCFLVDEFHFSDAFVAGELPRVSFCEAGGHPAWLCDMLTGFGIDTSVPDKKGRTELAQRIPMFAPFDAFIRELASRPGNFVLLEHDAYVREEVSPGTWLVRVGSDSQVLTGQ